MSDFFFAAFALLDTPQSLLDMSGMILKRKELVLIFMHLHLQLLQRVSESRQHPRQIIRDVL